MTDVGAGQPAARLALVVADAEWGNAVATGLKSADSPVSATLFGEVELALDDSAAFDCLVVECGMALSTSRTLPEQVGAWCEAIPVILVVEAADDREAVADADPTEVYVRTAEPHPERLARRVRTVVRATRAPDVGTTPQVGLRALLAELPTAVAVTDGASDVHFTNPAFKATFGLAKRLPEGVPPIDDGERTTVECETLDGYRSFRYGAVRLHDGAVCHVLRAQSASPLQPPGVAESTTATDEITGGVFATRPSLDDLTDRQLEVLQTAYEGGFFERPKAHNSEELAARLDITRSTYLQHLRTAQRKLFGQVFE